MYWVGWAVNRLTVSRNRIVTVASEQLTNPTLAWVNNIGLLTNPKIVLIMNYYRSSRNTFIRLDASFFMMPFSLQLAITYMSIILHKWVSATEIPISTKLLFWATALSGQKYFSTLIFWQSIYNIMGVINLSIYTVTYQKYLFRLKFQLIFLRIYLLIIERTH